jgi:hypothetical protein
MGISVATGLLESTDKRRAGLFIRQQSDRECKQRAGREGKKTLLEAMPEPRSFRARSKDMVDYEEISRLAGTI